MDNIITILPVDKQGRVTLANFFNALGWHPTRVTITFDSKTKELTISEAIPGLKSSIVDAKSRVFIGSLLRHKFFTQNAVYLVFDEATKTPKLYSADVDID